MNFLKKIFSKKEIEHDFAQEQRNLFKQQVEKALEKCKIEKKQEFENIDNIKKWAKDIIIEIFDVPTVFWYEELNKYENIKLHKKNIEVNKVLVEKTDLLIEEYREQIKLSNSKITFCETLINEYNTILERYENTAEKINQIKNEEKKLALLNKHKKRVAKMRSESSSFNEMYEETGILEILNNDISDIEDDFKIKQEVTEYINNLDKHFLEDTDNIDSLPIRKEIEKLSSEIKKK